MKVISHRQLVLSELNKACEKGLEVCGGTAESYAKEDCPVDTGNLRNSLTHEPESNRRMAIGTEVVYGKWVELGHHQQPGRYVPAIKKRLVASHVAGKPFLRPALENHQAEYRSILENALNGNED